MKRVQTEEDASTQGNEDSMTESKGFTCERCERAYEKPVLASVVSSGQTQVYYACPWCLTRVSPVQAEETFCEPASPDRADQAKKAATVEKVAAAGCTHYFGYLKKREKDKPIPDECLTCSKMVDCLMQ